MGEGAPAGVLPEVCARWFSARGWSPHPHQLAMLEAARAGRSTLLLAPTGGGKTLGGFLGSIAELVEVGSSGLHTLYVSPLKALTQDVHRNLLQPISEMDLGITAETRTGDTPQGKRRRQRSRPPDILLTTPESLALLLSYRDADRMFRGLRCVIIDEMHALVPTKRGELLSLGLARLSRLAPGLRRVGLSATVAFPDEMEAWLSATGRPGQGDVDRVVAPDGVQPKISIMIDGDRLPWSGHMGTYAAGEIYSAIRAHRTTLVFVNTRAQAELLFQALWRINHETLEIGLHHGSLAVEQRRRTEEALARGVLRAVVATSSLDLGVDWASVDLVVQVGAPKGVSRLVQRIGRSNHRIDQPSRAILAPANRFEVLECQAAVAALRRGQLDGDRPARGGLDVLAQHVLGTACSGSLGADDLYREVCTAAPYRDLSRPVFDRVLEFVETGGYALRVYDRFRRVARDADGCLRVLRPAVARSYRMNVGTIVETVTLRVRMRRGRFLGEVEEYFAQSLVRGDTFVFAGRLLTFEGIRETTVEVTPAAAGDPKVPAYAGGRLPLTTHLADGVRELLESGAAGVRLPGPVTDWLEAQHRVSVLPKRDRLLVEVFPRGERHYMVAYCFEGRNAHQTLGMLLTRRMERAGLDPLGFVATDYVIAVWSLNPARDVDSLFDQDMLGDDLEEWMVESSLLRRTFRTVAVIAGLIERRLPGQEKTGRQVTFSSDLIYDVLRRHEPDHILLQATRADAARGLTDIHRLGDMLARVQGRIDVQVLDRVSPLAVPVLLEIGRERVAGGALETQLEEAARDLVDTAMRPAPAAAMSR